MKDECRWQILVFKDKAHSVSCSDQVVDKKEVRWFLSRHCPVFFLALSWSCNSYTCKSQRLKVHLETYTYSGMDKSRKLSRCCLDIKHFQRQVFWSSIKLCGNQKQQSFISCKIEGIVGAFRQVEISLLKSPVRGKRQKSPAWDYYRL